jgi:hypothetical protein
MGGGKGLHPLSSRNFPDPNLKYPEDSELELTIPFDKAFHLSQLAVQLLPSAKIIDADSRNGLIQADSETFFAGHSTVTLTLKQKGDDATLIRIQSIYTSPHTSTVHDLQSTSQNQEIVTALRKSLQEQSQRLNDTNSRVQRSRNPRIAAILSLVVPGLGQAYNGQSALGVLIALSAGTGLLFGLVPGIIIWGVSVWYARSVAQKINEETIPFAPCVWYVMVLIVLFFVLLLILTYVFFEFFGPAVVLGINHNAICSKINC